jgi:hypothetical protein
LHLDRGIKPWRARLRPMPGIARCLIYHVALLPDCAPVKLTEIEDEDEFEYDDDWGTIARKEQRAGRDYR